jgi:hypothetical protein
VWLNDDGGEENEAELGSLQIPVPMTHALPADGRVHRVFQACRLSTALTAGDKLPLQMRPAQLALARVDPG